MKNPFYDLPIPNEGTLHRLDSERDACGVGFVANVHGRASRDILDMALCGVCNVQHRGAVDADRVTGDGAGVLVQLPHKVLMPVVEEMGHTLDHPQDLAVGVFFLPRDKKKRLEIHLVAEGILRNRKVKVLGWRDVPTNPNELGEKARRTMPCIQHLFVERPAEMTDDRFERLLTEQFVHAPYKFEIVEGANHWLPDQHPELVARLIAERAGT